MQQKRIVILGSGPAGMLMALSLAKCGINSIIIEVSKVGTVNHLEDPRTIALTLASKEFLDKIGLWSLISEAATQILDVYVVDNKSPKMLHFSQQTSGTEALGYMVKNSDLKKILLQAVRENSKISLIDGCTDYQLEDHNEYYKINFLGRSIYCDLLILCTGQHSQICKKYFSARLEKYYNQHALTFIVEHEQHHESVAVEHFLSPGVFAILPLSGGFHSSIVWTVPEAYAFLLRKLPIDEFEYIVQENFGNFLGKINLAGSVEAFPVFAYLTKKYYYNRAVVIASSAHVIHPLAGQGLNQGIKDIAALAELINTRDINQAMLEEYQNLRHNDNVMMYLITNNTNNIFLKQSLRPLRLMGLQIVEGAKIMKSQLIKYAMGRRL